MSGLKKRAPRGPVPCAWTPEQITNMSEALYRLRLGPAEVAAMLLEDQDDGQKIRMRAKSYDSMTRDYLEIIKQRGMPDEW